MMKSKHDLGNIAISILVDFDKKSRFSISILRSSQHYVLLLSQAKNSVFVKILIAGMYCVPFKPCCVNCFG